MSKKSEKIQKEIRALISKGKIEIELLLNYLTAYYDVSYLEEGIKLLQEKYNDKDYLNHQKEESSDPTKIPKKTTTPLAYAIALEKIKQVECLLNVKGIDLNNYPYLALALQLSISNKSTPTNDNIVKIVLEAIIKSGITSALNKPFYNGTYPIHYFAQQGKGELIAEILQAGAKPDVLGNKKETFLHYLISYNDVTTSLKTLKLLNEKSLLPADIINNNELGVTSLMIAVEKNYLPLVKYLLEDLQADPNIATKFNNRTAIHIAAEVTRTTEGKVDKDPAARKIRYEILKMLFKIDKVKNQINLQDKDGLTPLYLAVRDKQHDNIKLLLGNGANMEICSLKSAAYPIHMAILVKDFDSVKMLLEHGADIKAQNIHGANSWYYAVRAEDLDIINLLSKIYKEKFLDQDSYQEYAKSFIRTASNLFNIFYYLAFRIKDPEIIKLVLGVTNLLDPQEKRKLINQKSISDKTPLDILLLNNHFKTLELFISKFKDFINQESINSLIHIALLDGKTDLVEKLLQNYGLISKEINSKTKELYEILEKDSLNEVDSKKVKELLSQPEIQESARELLEIEYNTNDTDSTLETTNTDLEEVQDGKSYWWEDPKSLHQYHQEQKRQKLKVQSPDLFDQKDLGSITWSIGSKQVTVPISKNDIGTYETPEGIIVKTTGLDKKEIYIFIANECGIREDKKITETFIRAAAKGIKHGKLIHITGIKKCGDNGFELKIKGDSRLLGNEIFTINDKTPLYAFKVKKNHSQAKDWLKDHTIKITDSVNNASILTQTNFEEDWNSKESKESYNYQLEDRKSYTAPSDNNFFEKPLEGETLKFYNPETE